MNEHIKEVILLIAIPLIIVVITALGGCASVQLTDEQQKQCRDEPCHVVTESQLTDSVNEVWKKAYQSGYEAGKKWL